jgi:hypothetical protein
MRAPLACAAALLAIAACSACGSGSSGGADADPLLSYTDAGDGCPQVVSAISYADARLLPLGQEAYQKFTPAVRSNVAEVDGTQTLEDRDFPNRAILEQAQLTGRYATRAMAAGVPRRDRVRLLREYRREAASLVLLCAPYVDPTPSSAAGR